MTQADPLHGSNMAPRWPHRPPKWAQDGPKMAPRWPKLAQDGPKLAQDGPKLTPKAPKLAPEAPKMAPEAPKKAPEAPKMSPKAPQEGSQIAPKSVSQGLPSSKPKKGDPPPMPNADLDRFWGPLGAHVGPKLGPVRAYKAS